MKRAVSMSSMMMSIDEDEMSNEARQCLTALKEGKRCDILGFEFCSRFPGCKSSTALSTRPALCTHPAANAAGPGALRQVKPFLLCRLLKQQSGAKALVHFEKAHMLAKTIGNKVQERRAVRGLAAASRLQVSIWLVKFFGSSWFISHWKCD